MPPEITDGVPILLNDVVEPISRALEQAFATDAGFIDSLMSVRDRLQQQLTDTVPVFEVPGEEASSSRSAHSARASLTAMAVDEALRKCVSALRRTDHRNTNPRERHLPSVPQAVDALSDRSAWEGLAKQTNVKFWDEYAKLVEDVVGRVCGTRTGAARRIL